MNNETKILAMSLLSIFEGYKDRYENIYLNSNLDIIKEYNTETIEVEEVDEYGDTFLKKEEKIKDEKLQKIILKQEKYIKEKLNKEEKEIEKLLNKKNEKIEMVVDILDQILDRKEKSK